MTALPPQRAESARWGPRLDPRYVVLQRELGRYVTVGMVFIVLAGALFLFWQPTYFWALLLAALVTPVAGWTLHRWPAVEYRYTSYRVDEAGIEIHRGVVWRAVVTVPRSRVQHTDVSQGPLERKHGLGRLVIYTAGTAHSRVELPGLAHETAFEIRDHLLPRAAADGV